MEKRRVGHTDMEVTIVSMGCWPITGITSVNVTREQSLATLHAALDAGINSFDTAFAYGEHGESEKMIASALGTRRDEIIIASKCGLHWENGRTVRDARPETIRAECEESLRRLQTDVIDIYYLHGPDAGVPVGDSAQALAALKAAGKIRAVGVSNFSREQLQEFHSVTPIDAFQPPYNLLQREIEESTLPWCREHGVAVCAYWPLLKGLLAGGLSRDHVFPDQDGRKKYPMFQGDEYQKNLDFVDELRTIAAESDCSVAQLAIAWTVAQPGITSALCGAKRAGQIRENAAAMSVELSAETLAQIDAALNRRGQIQSRPAM